MEVDGSDEVLLVAETTCGVLDPLDFGVDGLAGGVRDSEPQIGNDVGEAALDHASFFDHGFQAAADRPVVPPAIVFPCGALVVIEEERHHGLLQSPSPRCF